VPGRSRAEGKEKGKGFVVAGSPIKRHRVKKKIFTVSFLTRISSYTAYAGYRTITVADVFNQYGVSVYCTSHPSGLRTLDELPYPDPLSLISDPENLRFHIASKCVITGFVVINQPHSGSRHGQ
jgi:hypothetical protein